MVVCSCCGGRTTRSVYRRLSSIQMHEFTTPVHTHTQTQTHEQPTATHIDSIQTEQSIHRRVQLAYTAAHQSSRMHEAVELSLASAVTRQIKFLWVLTRRESSVLVLLVSFGFVCSHKQMRNSHRWRLLTKFV